MAKVPNAASTKKAKARGRAVPGAKRARTREKLLNSAAELFESKGIFAVSLDEVATRAGLSKGAIYGNFKSKDDLVFAVTAERSSRAIPILTDDAPLREQLRAMIGRSFERHPNGRRHFAFLAELDLYALTHEDLARRFIKAAREIHEESAQNIAHLTKKGRLSLAPLEFAIVANALVHALIFQHACYPDIVTEEVAMKALDALVG
ncbi:MAG TPA: TetR/AcrR family transcriptional regulator [Steroidobacteraceae bacterium]